MSMRTRLMAAFAVPIALLLTTVGVVAIQQRAVRQVVLAAEARDFAHTADDMIRQLLATIGAPGESQTEETVYWRELDGAVHEAAARAATLSVDAGLTSRLEAGWEGTREAWEEYRGLPDEVTSLYLEESLADLSEALSVFSVGLRNGFILAAERERNLRDLPLRFGAAVGVVAALVSGAFAWWFARRIADPLDALARASARIAEGDLDVEIARSGLPEVDRLATSFGAMAGSLRRLLAQIGASRGSLTETAESIRGAVHSVAGQAEQQTLVVERTSLAVAQMTESIGSVADEATHLSENAHDTSESMTEMDRATAGTAEGMSQLQEEIESCASSVAELGSSMASVVQQSHSLDEAAESANRSLFRIQESVARIESTATESAELARSVSAGAKSGLHVMGQANEGMNAIENAFQRIEESVAALSEGSQSILKILDAIGSIADQTQLLSLNAAIIAAQAGEDGHAFAVVANEVSSLAERATESVQNVADRLGEISEGIDSSVEAAREGSSQVGVGASRVREAAGRLEEMAEQARASEERADEIAGVASEGRTAVATVGEETARTSSVAAELGRAMAEQQAASIAMLESIERIRTLGLEACSATDSQKMESPRITGAARSVAERTESIRKATAAQRSQAAEIEVALGVFRSAAAEWAENVAGLEGAMATLLANSEDLGSQMGHFSIGAGSSEDPTEAA